MSMNFDREQQSNTFKKYVLELFQTENDTDLSTEEKDSLNNLIILCPLRAEEPLS